MLPVQIGSIVTVLVSAGLGLATVGELQKLIEQQNASDNDDHLLDELSLAYVAILLGCVGFLTIGLVGVISNSLLVHGANKVSA